MLIYTEKVFKDSSRYIELSIYGGNSFTLIINKVTKRRFWFNKVEQIRKVRYSTNLNPSELVNEELENIRNTRIKEWA